MRIAAAYGLWATIWFAVTSIAVSFIMGTSFWRMLDWLKATLPLTAAVFVVAGLGWLLLHRRGRQPGVVGYSVLAIAITLIINLVFAGGLLFIDVPSAAVLHSLDKFAMWALISLLLHGWFTIPIALLATWLFVRRQRRSV